MKLKGVTEKFALPDNMKAIVDAIRRVIGRLVPQQLLEAVKDERTFQSRNGLTPYQILWQLREPAEFRAQKGYGSIDPPYENNVIDHAFEIFGNVFYQDTELNAIIDWETLATLMRSDVALTQELCQVLWLISEDEQAKKDYLKIVAQLSANSLAIQPESIIPSPEETEVMLAKLQANTQLNPRIAASTWPLIKRALLNSPSGLASLRSLDAMQGDPGVLSVGFDGSIVICDFSLNLDQKRTKLTYDLAAQVWYELRLFKSKYFHPIWAAYNRDKTRHDLGRLFPVGQSECTGNVIDLTRANGINIMDEASYRTLRSFLTPRREQVWIQTPKAIRTNGLAIVANDDASTPLKFGTTDPDNLWNIKWRGMFEVHREA
jgi:hypothetical protein